MNRRRRSSRCGRDGRRRWGRTGQGLARGSERGSPLRECGSGLVSCQNPEDSLGASRRSAFTRETNTRPGPARRENPGRHDG
jgi:hypothetical protein